MTPNKEKGANDFKFFNKQRGNNTNPVTPSKVGLRDVESKLEKVSANTMEKAKQAKNVLSVTVQAGIHEVLSPIVAVHASRKLLAPVYAQTLPINAKP
mmetsp:Transcript_19627/g.28770  ORF Transcript_19627/g.28770 Transcript_19627/m.28770 type:complete len:98 (+) Transcript_19627:948-1241(+)